MKRSYVVGKIAEIVLKTFKLGFYKYAFMPGFYVKSSAKYFDTFVFDFSDKTMVHLGDQLFFFEAIFGLRKAGFKVIVLSSQDYISSFLSNSFESTVPCDFDYKKSVVIVPIYASSLAHTAKFGCVVGYDFSGNAIDNKLSKLIQRFFKLRFSIDISLGRRQLTKLMALACKADRLGAVAEIESFNLFSPYLNSGFFRKFFLKDVHSRFLASCKLGRQCRLVGSLNDKLYSFGEDCRLLDSRGEFSFCELIFLFHTGRVNKVIAFDNFFMHLAELFSIKSEIIFRGRFLKRSRLQHLQYVNCTMSFRGKSFVRYL
jgi:hypothetical protein